MQRQQQRKSGSRNSPRQAGSPVPGKAELRAELEARFPALVEALMQDPLMREMPAEARAWIRRMVEYTVPFGKMTRGITVLSTAIALGGDRDDAAVLGWCVEWLQACFLVADDIMDASKVRRGRACWYRLEDVGMNGVNDSFLLKSHVYRLIERKLRDRPFAALAKRLLTEVAFETELGQLLDLTSQPAGEGNVRMERFTEDAYRRIVKYKTAQYSFYLPVALGLCAAGVVDERIYEEARAVCCRLGEYFQVQDDYLDCYGAPEVIGKVGRDIEEKKCGWLAVQAVKRCSAAQREVFERCYGRDDPNMVAQIKRIYEELDMKSVYAEYSRVAYADCKSAMERFAQACPEVPAEIFERLLASLHKRSK
jgi:farnesyl diphosphate synthase